MDSLSVVVFGDMQEQNEIAQRVIQVAAEIQPDLCIILGDLVGTGTDQAQWDRCNEMLAPLTSQCELVAIPGNHDYEAPGVANNFAAHFRPQKASPYVSLSRLGSRFILLDTMLYDQTMERGHFPLNSPQGIWLENELKDAQKQGEAAFVCGHHPIFMSPELYFSTSPTIRIDETNDEVGSALLSALIQGKAQIYFAGHIHLYDRSRFEGISCITSGATSYEFPNVKNAGNRFSELCLSKHHLCHLEIGAGVVKFKAIDQWAEVFDAWEEPLRVKSSS